jgi:2-octaprenyl-6-methoxyphenol hydroxylase
MKKNNIIILGCGISGMLTALSLARESIETNIIEIKNEKQLIDPCDPRTTALNQSSIDFFSEIGIIKDIETYLEPIKDIFVCQNMKDNIYHMKGNGKILGYMIKNSDLRRVLYEISSNNKLIKIQTQKNYEIIDLAKNSIKLEITSEDSKQEIQTELCIAADGRFSKAKTKFFKNRMFKDYNQKAIVFNIDHELPHEGGAIEHFLPRGSFATLPLNEKNSSGIVWVEKTDIADFYLTQTNKILEAQISKFIGSALGEVKIATKPESFPLGAFISENYFYSRLVLVADSAHAMHPLAGQGLNMGIKDVKTLSNLISRNSKLGLAYDEIMLSQYEKIRKFDNIAMVRITDNINKIFTSKSKILNKITSFGLSTINKMPILQEFLIDYAKGLR